MVKKFASITAMAKAEKRLSRRVMMHQNHTHIDGRSDDQQSQISNELIDQSAQQPQKVCAM